MDTEDLPEQERKERAAVKMAIQKKIRSWYNHKRTSAGLARNPFAPWLARLHCSEGPAPKCLADYQYYMQHNNLKLKVQQLFEEHHPGVPASQHLNLWCAIACELLQNESKEVKVQIKQEAANEHQELWMCTTTQWRDCPL
ncbi:hypothetical protein B0H10DRAFT_1950096 [Mycena sp. CBHHK59/15]|nr:hypothetical protein B0H10DRAFT_1950096 [Mycena sp. CBHHK59/15]